MQLPTTEMLHDKAAGLDDLPLEDAALILLEGQAAAAQISPRVGLALQGAAQAMAQTISCGGTLYYVAAGSSALMAAADAMELGGTFSIPATQVRIIMAGGLPTSAEMPGETEDGIAELAEGLSGLTATDTVITVSASGSTPFTIEAASNAKRIGATIIGIANNQGSPLLEAADHAIFLETPPEVVSGSTRLGAGTAQKIALNTLSTLMAVELGHIYDGMMVNLRADNEKLRGRALRIVGTIARVEEVKAADALRASEGNVKLAVLIAAGANGVAHANALLNDASGKLRPALHQLENGN